MNVDDIPTRVVQRSTSVGSNGIFKLEIRVNVGKGYKFSDVERDALYTAEELIKEAFLETKLSRDPEAQRKAADERKSLLECFPAPIFVETIPNGYCSRACCKHLPWFKVTTVKGRITIGWRKSVISISWEDGVNESAVDLFPAETSTRCDRTIHAWSLDDAKRYITKLLE